MTASARKAMLGWFLAEGGRLDGADIGVVDGSPAMVAARNLAAGERVLHVPRRLLVTVDTAAHSPVGYRLRATTVESDRAYLAAWLAQARWQPGPWRPMLDAAPDFSHLPERFERADWDLLRDSQVHTLARESWSQMLRTFRGLADTMPRARRLRLRDFAWGWHMAGQALGMPGEGVTKPVIVPFGDRFAHSPDANCRFESDRSGAFQVFTTCDVQGGSPLTLSRGRLSNPVLMARYGISIENNPHEAAALRVSVPQGHWIHEIAPGLTGGHEMLELRLTDDPQDKPRLLMLLRLLGLPSREAARRSLNSSAWFDCRPALNPANELAAMRRLGTMCDAALAAFSCSAADDDLLLQAPGLSPRQRHAIVTRRAEKRLLQRHSAFARDAIRLFELPAQAPMPELQARDAGPVLDASERTLLTWFEEAGGVLNGAALAVHDGVRGMVATRDIAKGDVLIGAPRHTLLTNDVARHSPIGIGLREAGAGVFSNFACIAAFLLETRRCGGHWSAMLGCMPRSFDLPDSFSREDWKLLDGTDVQAPVRAFWHRLKNEFRHMRRILSPPQRFRLRDFLWACQAVRSRAFHLRIDGGIVAMVPFADMLNHAGDANCAWEADTRRGFAMVALRDIAAGTPLTHRYCDSDNVHLLSMYGFCLDAGAHTGVTLGFAIGKPHWLHEFATELTGNDPEPRFKISDEAFGHDGRRMLSFLRLLGLAGPDEAKGHPRIDRTKLQDVPMLDPRNEHGALQRLVAQCEQRLAAFGCGDEVDAQLLAAGGLSSRQRNALTVRRGQRRVLEQTRAIAGEVMRALHLQPDEMRAALRSLEACSPWAAYLQELCFVGTEYLVLQQALVDAVDDGQCGGIAAFREPPM